MGGGKVYPCIYSHLQMAAASLVIIRVQRIYYYYNTVMTNLEELKLDFYTTAVMQIKLQSEHY